MTFARRPLPSRYVSRGFVERKKPMAQISKLASEPEKISLTCAVAGLSSHDTLIPTSFPTSQAPAEAEPSATTRPKKMMKEGSGAGLLRL